ncbi:hypothetical protein Goklo_001037 [Gossypium klotzschianum]|uniref:DUF4283 domain-containing protein n=1 Tax=Gossypium klotzschianum TaxID=34286 RepID=A0A7J8VZ27_9ROSI|nr:hypothetical protein [Gossypium klotzschianum]
MENELANLSFDVVKEEVLLVQRYPGSQVVKNNFILVECFLTASIVHFPTMKSTMANLWHLIRGDQISDLGDKKFSFKFFPKMDLDLFRRAGAMHSVWFIEDNDGGGFGSNSQQPNLGSGTQEGVWRDLGVRLDLMLGFNLEGGNSSLGQVGGLVHMEHNAEELLIVSGNGKKRP